MTPAVARQPTAVVIGGGWAGFGAAWGLAQRGVAVTVLEASSDAVGGLAAGWKGPDAGPHLSLTSGWAEVGSPTSAWAEALSERPP